MSAIVQKLNADVKDKISNFNHFVIVLRKIRRQEPEVGIQKGKCGLTSYVEKEIGFEWGVEFTAGV